MLNTEYCDITAQVLSNGTCSLRYLLELFPTREPCSPGDGNMWMSDYFEKILH